MVDVGIAWRFISQWLSPQVGYTRNLSNSFTARALVLCMGSKVGSAVLRRSCIYTLKLRTRILCAYDVLLSTDPITLSVFCFDLTAPPFIKDVNHFSYLHRTSCTLSFLLNFTVPLSTIPCFYVYSRRSLNPSEKPTLLKFGAKSRHRPSSTTYVTRHCCYIYGFMLE